MKRVLLKCPICEKTRIQRIPQALTQNREKSEKGILTILIPDNTICEHMFVIQVDRHFHVRDAFSIDTIKEINKKKFVYVKEIENMIASLKPKTIKQILKDL